MKRPLILWIAPLIIFERGVVLLYEGLFWEKPFHHYAEVFIRPALFLGAAAWLWWQPRRARGVVGLFFVAVTIRGILQAFSATDLSVYLMSWRPVTYGIAAWFAYGLLASGSVRRFVLSQKQNSAI